MDSVEAATVTAMVEPAGYMRPLIASNSTTSMVGSARKKKKKRSRGWLKSRLTSAPRSQSGQRSNSPRVRDCLFHRCGGQVLRPALQR